MCDQNCAQSTVQVDVDCFEIRSDNGITSSEFLLAMASLYTTKKTEKKTDEIVRIISKK